MKTHNPAIRRALQEEFSFNDSFANEHNRYMNRLARSQNKQDFVYGEYMERIHIPKRTHEVHQSSKEELLIEEQKNKLQQVMLE